MSITRDALDLDILPNAARTELLDFYEFLRGKYGAITKTQQKKEAAQQLCDRASARAIELPADYHFDRIELHER